MRGSVGVLVPLSLGVCGGWVGGWASLYLNLSLCLNLPFTYPPTRTQPLSQPLRGHRGLRHRALPPAGLRGALLPPEGGWGMGEGRTFSVRVHSRPSAWVRGCRVPPLSLRLTLPPMHPPPKALAPVQHNKQVVRDPIPLTSAQHFFWQPNAGALDIALQKVLIASLSMRPIPKTLRSLG